MGNFIHRVGSGIFYRFYIERGQKNNIGYTKMRDLGHEIGYHYEVLSKTKGDQGEGQ
jgi:hypothetical protein